MYIQPLNIILDDIRPIIYDISSHNYERLKNPMPFNIKKTNSDLIKYKNKLKILYNKFKIDVKL